jgi:hypothetical protein
VAQDPAVALPQRFQAHLGDEVGRAIHVVTRKLLYQATFPLHAFVQASAQGRLQQTHHGRHNAALLDEVDLLLEDGGRITVEADDKPALYLETCALQALYALHQVAALVLVLVALHQALFTRGLDSDKDSVEAGLDAEGQQTHRRQVNGISVLNGVPVLPLHRSIGAGT